MVVHNLMNMILYISVAQINPNEGSQSGKDDNIGLISKSGYA